MLREQTYAGAREPVPRLDEKVRAQLERELELIIRLGISGLLSHRLGHRPVLQ